MCAHHRHTHASERAEAGGREEHRSWVLDPMHAAVASKAFSATRCRGAF